MGPLASCTPSTISPSSMISVEWLNSSSRTSSSRSEFSTPAHLIYISSTSSISKPGKRSSSLASFVLALLKTYRVMIFSLRKLMVGSVSSRCIPSLVRPWQHFWSYWGLPQMAKTMEKDQMRFLLRNCGFILDFTSLTSSGMTLCLMSRVTACLQSCFMWLQAFSFSLCSTFMMQYWWPRDWKVADSEVSVSQTNWLSLRSAGDILESCSRVMICVERWMKREEMARQRKNFIWHVKIITFVNDYQFSHSNIQIQSPFLLLLHSPCNIGLYTCFLFIWGQTIEQVCTFPSMFSQVNRSERLNNARNIS